MKTHRRLSIKRFPFLIIAALAVGCATTPYINVNYRLSEPSDIPAGQQVFIDFKDDRPDQAFLGKEAQSYLTHFNDRFHLFLGNSNKNNEFTGSYDLKTLFKETLNLRLRNHGVQVVKMKSENCSVLEIELNKFTLDLKDKKWITSIAYAARWVYENGDYLVENISATAERHKIWGKKEAEKTLSEAITDAVNKLDIQRLFERSVR